MFVKVKNWFGNLFREYKLVFSKIRENKISTKEGVSNLLTKYSEFIKEVKFTNPKNDYFSPILIQKLKASIENGKPLAFASFRKELYSKIQYLCIELFENGVETYIAKTTKNRIIFNPSDFIESDLLRERSLILDTILKEDKDFEERRLIAEEKKRIKLAKKGIVVEELVKKPIQIPETEIEPEEIICENIEIKEPIKPVPVETEISNFDENELLDFQETTNIKKPVELTVDDMVDDFINKNNDMNERDEILGDQDDGFDFKEEPEQKLVHETIMSTSFNQPTIIDDEDELSYGQNQIIEQTNNIPETIDDSETIDDKELEKNNELDTNDNFESNNETNDNFENNYDDVINSLDSVDNNEIEETSEVNETIDEPENNNQDAEKETPVFTENDYVSNLSSELFDDELEDKDESSPITISLDESIDDGQFSDLDEAFSSTNTNNNSQEPEQKTPENNSSFLDDEEEFDFGGDEIQNISNKDEHLFSNNK